MRVIDFIETFLVDDNLEVAVAPLGSVGTIDSSLVLVSVGETTKDRVAKVNIHKESLEKYCSTEGLQLVGPHGIGGAFDYTYDDIFDSGVSKVSSYEGRLIIYSSDFALLEIK